MPQEPYITRMAEAGLIFGKPIYHGCTLWRAYGLALIDQMLATLKATLEGHIGRTCVHLKHGMFNDSAFYKKLEQSATNYLNVFEIGLDGELGTIRSDTVQSNVSHLLASSDNCEAVLSLTSIYRKGKGRALFVDQNIFPTFSLNCFSPMESPELGIARIKRCLDAFFDALLLPRLWICRPEGFERYGDFLLMPLMPENDSQLTVCATVFLLSEAFRRIFDVPAHLVDVGLTSRLLAVYYIYQEAREHVILPSSTAPVQCMLLNEAAEQIDLIRHLESDRIRFARVNVAERAKQRGSRRAMKAGIPLQIYRNHKGQLLLRRCFDGQVSELRNFNEIKAHLRESDSLIARYNQDAFDAVLRKTTLVELSVENVDEYAHRNGFDQVGRVYVSTPGSMATFLFVSKAATGTIREKM